MGFTTSDDGKYDKPDFRDDDRYTYTLPMCGSDQRGTVSQLQSARRVAAVAELGSLGKRNMKTAILAASLAIAWLAGCASTSRIQVNVTASQPDAYKATIRALVKNGFQLDHTERSSGVVTGERPLKNLGTNREAGKMLRVTILVEEFDGDTTLFVTWTPPEWALGSCKPEHDEFIEGLSLELPNAKVTSTIK